MSRRHAHRPHAGPGHHRDDHCQSKSHQPPPPPPHRDYCSSMQEGLRTCQPGHTPYNEQQSGSHAFPNQTRTIAATHPPRSEFPLSQSHLHSGFLADRANDGYEPGGLEALAHRVPGPHQAGSLAVGLPRSSDPFSASYSSQVAYPHYYHPHQQQKQQQLSQQQQQQQHQQHHHLHPHDRTSQLYSIYPHHPTPYALADSHVGSQPHPQLNSSYLPTVSSSHGGQSQSIPGSVPALAGAAGTHYLHSAPPFNTPSGHLPSQPSVAFNSSMQAYYLNQFQLHHDIATKALLAPYEGISKGKKYTLFCRQQPVRARMCGFGDKDRRPITPPPCLHLVVTDVNSGVEYSPSDLHPTYFVITADLWTADGTREVSLVRHNHGAGTSTTSTTASAPFPAYSDSILGGFHNPLCGEESPNSLSSENYTYLESQSRFSQLQSRPAHGPPLIIPLSAPPPLAAPPIQQPPPSQFTRNLIGSLTVNGFILKDDNKVPGIWFIFQDLSVRTEGTFRLRFNFIDVSGEDGGLMRLSKAPVLATVFSAPFQVYSAKKFPGVIESTPLSKVFANQGIKIPIRKDGTKDKEQLSGDCDD